MWGSREIPIRYGVRNWQIYLPKTNFLNKTRRIDNKNRWQNLQYLILKKNLDYY